MRAMVQIILLPREVRDQHEHLFVKLILKTRASDGEVVNAVLKLFVLI